MLFYWPMLTSHEPCFGKQFIDTKKAVKKYYWQLISFVLPFKASIHHIAGALTFHVNDHSHSNMQQAGFRRLRHTYDLQSEIFENNIIPDNCFELVTDYHYKTFICWQTISFKRSNLRCYLENKKLTLKCVTHTALITFSCFNFKQAWKSGRRCAGKIEQQQDCFILELGASIKVGVH